ncbi:MAG TPA: CPBP family intramembrane metalloprotease [Polyangiaceae bacterium]|nr:CPBP family intramembrane metalloprotease [Polyangiaceae bacterium]
MSEGSSPRASRDTTWLRLLTIAIAWLALQQVLARYGAYLVPLSVARHLTLQTFLMIVQVVVTAAGLGLAAIVLRSLRRDMGIGLPSRWQASTILLSTPMLFVLASYVAIGIALPTLMEEIARGGAAVSQQNAGEFGRALKKDPVVLTVVWGVVFAPFAEELLFRGALWSAVASLTRRFERPREQKRDSLETFLEESAVQRAARAVWRWALQGGIATLFAAAVFGWMHADMKGGVGIVRVVSTTCLGLACGAARHVTGSVLAAVLVHFVFNLLSIGQTRRWWAVAGFSSLYGVSTLIMLVASLLAIALLVVWIARRSAQRRDAMAAAEES